MNLSLKCPIWKIVNPPFTSLKLTKESMNKPISLRKTMNTKPTIKSINTK